LIGVQFPDPIFPITESYIPTVCYRFRRSTLPDNHSEMRGGGEDAIGIVVKAEFASDSINAGVHQSARVALVVDAVAAGLV
jgi:hypothetical protein